MIKFKTILEAVNESITLTKKQRAKGLNVSDLRKARIKDKRRRKLRKNRPKKRMKAATKNKMLKSRKLNKNRAVPL